MIDIGKLNDELVAQDEGLRRQLSSLVGNQQGSGDRILAEGLCAIHERLGNLITLMLQVSN